MKKFQLKKILLRYLRKKRFKKRYKKRYRTRRYGRGWGRKFMGPKRYKNNRGKTFNSTEQQQIAQGYAPAPIMKYKPYYDRPIGPKAAAHRAREKFKNREKGFADFVVTAAGVGRQIAKVYNNPMEALAEDIARPLIKFDKWAKNLPYTAVHHSGLDMKHNAGKLGMPWSTSKQHPSYEVQSFTDTISDVIGYAWNPVEKFLDKVGPRFKLNRIPQIINKIYNE